MHLVWKRPDGFHGATPQDYRVIDVGKKAKIWVHVTDKSNFPFRISGGWQDEEASERLNQLVNLLPLPIEEWLSHLSSSYHDSSSEQPEVFLEEIHTWLCDLQSCLKGDHWERDIMAAVLSEIAAQLTALAPAFSEAHSRDR